MLRTPLMFILLCLLSLSAAVPVHREAEFADPDQATESDLDVSHQWGRLRTWWSPKTPSPTSAPTITPPFEKTSRIVIVGAGPSGVHMAAQLDKLGYKNVTLLERTHRVGGKSFTLYRGFDDGKPCTQTKDPKTGVVDTESCIAHEMGTCFLHNGYRIIRALVDEYKLKPEIVPEGRAVFSQFTTPPRSQELSEFVSETVAAGLESGKIQRPWWLPKFMSTSLQVTVSLLHAVRRYNKLHGEIFGEMAYTMPDRLSKEQLARIDMPFVEFLERNNLQAIAGLLTFAHAAQGYGYVSSIPAFYGLWWISPELLNGYVQMSFHEQIESLTGRSVHTFVGRMIRGLVTALVGGDAEGVSRTTTMLPEGYGKIWAAMTAAHGLRVKFGVEIEPRGIVRGGGGAPVSVRYRQDGGAPVTEAFDFLIYSAPFKHANKYVDIAAEEQSIFQDLEAYVLSTTIYTSSAVPGYTDSTDKPIMYDTLKMQNHTTDGGWYADRNDMRIFGGRSAIDKPSQMRVGYQFYERPCAVDATLCDSDRFPHKHGERFEQIADKVLSKFKSQLSARSAENVTIIEQYPWPYFHHFPQRSISSGRPWDLLDIQGRRSTFWIGASACFESVHDVTSYNERVLDQFHLR